MSSIEKSVFSSQDLPPELNDKARFDRWVDIMSPIGPADYEVCRDMPFVARNATYSVGDIIIGSASGSITGVNRTRRHVSANVAPCYYLFINSGQGLVHGVQAGREITIASGCAALLSDSEPVQMHGGYKNDWEAIFVPQPLLDSRFDNAPDSLARVIGASSEGLGLIKQFGQFLAGAEMRSSTMIEHAADSLTDLIGLVSGLVSRELPFSGSRGLRAARLQAIQKTVADQFDDPHINAQRVALQLGLSVRYVHDLLQETGASFGDRVLELRLNKTKAMLTDMSYSHMRVSDIAFMCGFSDISYFNRCFRRRFGCTPTAAR